MTIQSALDKLFSLHQFGMKLGLDNILNLLEQIGNPHKKIKTFHVAGSNGKGSTASFIASILMEAGYKVGLYTSPHFRIYNERIRINGKMINDEYVVAFIASLEEYIEKNSPTFFEITTALAFKYFEEQNVDYAVIETGLGGRLDATNVIHPIASVITSISLEHTQHLGNTIEKIAFEKAGIIKSNSIVLTGRIPAEAKKVFEETALQCGSKYFPVDDYIKIEKERVVITCKEKLFSLYSTPLQGDHQLLNAALAIKTVDECLSLKNGLVYSKGIKNVIKNTGIEGRYEIVNSRPKIIFDSAHNLEGITSFIEEFSKEYKSYSERVLVFGAMRDKAIAEMLSALNPYFSKIYVTKIDIDRSATTEELHDIASAAGIKVRQLKDPVLLVNRFFEESEDKCLVVLGSMYLLGEIKLQMFKENA
jgi:dihydrofolate synthase/folylpolyglutamate synthase